MHVSVELWQDWMIGVTLSDLVCQRLIAERRPFLSSRFRKVLFTNEVIQVVEGFFCFPPVLQFVLTEMYYDGFHRSFCDDDDDLDIIQESDSIFAFETPETFRLENIRTKRGTPHRSSLACIPVVFLRRSFPRLTSLPTSPGALSPDSQRPGVC